MGKDNPEAGKDNPKPPVPDPKKPAGPVDSSGKPRKPIVWSEKAGTRDFSKLLADDEDQSSKD